MFDFKEKKIIVTGGTRGIGKAIAESILNLDGEVVVTGTGRETPVWCGNYHCCEYRPLDFLDKESIRGFISFVESLAKVDVLVNNAGIHIPKSIHEQSDSEWQSVLQVNLNGPRLLIKAISRHMMANHYGRIVNTASIAGLISRPGQSAYSASKSGMIGLTRATALELAPFHILINALCPGTTQTEMVESLLTKEQKERFKAKIPLGRFATVEEIACFAVFLCSDANTYITGQAIIVDGGTTIQ